jgi:tetratricopeptide (TPR) repeat protein
MSKTLKLLDCLLARGRNLQQLGREQDALILFERLAGFRQLPRKIAEETQVRLAEILLERGEYQAARRHLTAALAQKPTGARYHFLMAQALEADENGNDRRALDHYRMSLQLDGDQPECLGKAGMLALQLGKVVDGLKWLRRAVELAPDDPEAVARLVEGLQEVGRSEEARLTLRAALFRNPRDGRFRKLWSDFHFQQLRQEQESKRQARYDAGTEEKPIVLPFLRPVSVPTQSRGKRVRRDPAGPLPSPHLPRRGRLPYPRHAQ